MSELDEKLKQIVLKATYFDKAVEDIKQAFKDAGYVGPYLEPKDTPGKYRTGQEWYTRFEKKLDEVDWWRPDKESTRYNVECAAERASGIDNLNCGRQVV